MKFIAHRGYSHLFAENSLPAFQAVIDHPCNGGSLTGIELDVHLTADGRIPVMHETTVPDDNDRPIPVARCTFDELQRLFKKQYGGKRPEVPDFVTMLGLIGHRTELCIEIKYGPYDLEQFTRLFTDALTSYQPRGDVVVSSFSYEILEYVRPHLAGLNIRYGFIFNSFNALDAVPRTVRDRFDLLHPWYRLLLDDPERFSALGLPLRCWTVNDPDLVHTLIDRSAVLPLEAIMTDNIELARQFTDV
jgi:glycerophosphoryl diester phosphodiesterase